MNNKNRNKTTTLKTLLMLSVVTMMMLIPGGIIPVHALPGDLLLEINNPTPAEDDYFSRSVAITSTDDILVSSLDDTGAENAGSVYLFDGTDGSLLLTINNPTPEEDDRFGSVAVTSTGDILIGASSDDTGATNAGSAYLFDGNDGSLLLTINNPTPEEDDRFGSVAVTNTGDLLIGASFDDTGATNAGSAYLFDGNDGSLLLTINNPTPEKDDYFGSPVAVTSNGDLLIGAWGDNAGNKTNAGSVYLFDGTDGSLLLTINNPTPAVGDIFGGSVAVTNTGDILIGAYGDDTGATFTGSAYLFDSTNGNLLLTINNPTPAEDDYFGRSVAVTSNGDLLIGAWGDNTGAADTGSVYLFDGTDGSLLLTIHNPTPERSDNFGYSVAVTSTGDLLIGVYRESTSATNAGAVYLFEGISQVSSPSPIITSIVADDPDDLDNVYSADDIITITFDSATNMPGGTDRQTSAAIDDLFTFTESLGQAYRGQWTASDTFVITIKSANNAGPPVIDITTVTPSGITPILSFDETSSASYITSPALSGDFGTASPVIQWIQLPLTDGIPLTTDCDGIEEYGRVMLDAQGSTENTLYLCTASGWIAK